MKYYVYIYREFSHCEFFEFTDKESALKCVGANWISEDGYVQLIEGKDLNFSITHVAECTE